MTGSVVIRCTCGHPLERVEPRPGTVVWSCRNPRCRNSPDEVAVGIDGRLGRRYGGVWEVDDDDVLPCGCCAGSCYCDGERVTS